MKLNLENDYRPHSRRHLSYGSLTGFPAFTHTSQGGRRSPVVAL